MIIQCPGCHTNYEVGDSIPPEGGNVRCAACNNIWLAIPDNDPETTPTASYENPTFSSEDISPPPDISNSPDTITSESDNAEATHVDKDINFQRDFEPHQSNIAGPDIDREQYFDEVQNEQTTIPAAPTEDIDKPCEGPISNGTTYSGQTTQSLNSNGHDLDPGKSGLTSIANEIEQAIGAGTIATAHEPEPQSNSLAFSNIKIFSWVAVISAMVGSIIFAFINPDRTARALPSTVGLFDAIGIKTNSRGLVIRNVKYERTSLDQRPALKVNGNVENITNGSLKVPTIVVELRDKDNLILFIWATEVEQPNLGSKATVPFSVVIPAPTKLVRTVKLRFSTRS